MMPSNISNLPEITVGNFTCQQLLANLQNTIHKPRPSSIIFKWRDNKKLKLDEEHQRSIISQISNLRTMQKEFVNLQAEAIFSHEMVDMLVAGMRAEAEILAKNNALQLLLVNQKNEIAPIQHEDEKDQIKHTQEMRELERRGVKLEHLKLQAGINHTNALTEESKIKTKIISDLFNKVDINELPPELKTYVIVSTVNPNEKQYNEFQMQDRIKDLIFQREEEKNKQEQAKTKKEQSQADIERTVADKTVNDVKKRKNND